MGFKNESEGEIITFPRYRKADDGRPTGPTGNDHADSIEPVRNSEDAVAQTLIDSHPEFRFVPDWSSWMRFNGIRWQRDKGRRVWSAVRSICRDIGRDENLPSEQKRLGSSKTHAAIVSMATSDQRAVTDHARFDANPMALNTPKGILDLTTGRMSPHDVDGDQLFHQGHGRCAGLYPGARLARVPRPRHQEGR
jgi:hypothetical protein